MSLSTYSTRRLHSILGQNLTGACRRSFGRFFRPYYIALGIFGFFAENQSREFWDFLI